MNPCAVLPAYWCSKPDPSASWVLLHAPETPLNYKTLPLKPSSTVLTGYRIHILSSLWSYHFLSLFITLMSIYHFLSLFLDMMYQSKRSSSVSTLVICSVCADPLMPSALIMISFRAFFFFVYCINTLILLSNSSSSLEVIERGVSVNFSSHRFVMQSARSITRSICAPPSFLLLIHEYSFVFTPDIPKAFFICSI